MSEDQRERFAPTGGRIMGGVGLALAVLVVGIGVIDRDADIPTWTIVLAALIGLLCWAAMLRPRVSVVGDRLELRNMLETVSIPLAAIEELAVRQLLAVRAGDRRYVSPAVGKSRRQLRRQPSGPATDVEYADFVEGRIRQRMEDARAVAGIRLGSPEQVALGQEVRRSPAWPELVGVVLLSVALVVSLVL
ncbi:hypothetical protein [Nocardioides sp. cx-173]|uniref:hypothetical protein n=1 Tax=Nocardioides sp. cx-173 TaxID=2898796 RepID=UPI001E4C29F9|nr:hypothetical protein [Nocardioides sp. cx-173]MCD4526964.1 hypothetical protein [Nocardioides sp. cx-173]UGB41101.1 hypothetical protein LQ940_17230 [Nocardioides sp. cx-173]